MAKTTDHAQPSIFDSLTIENRKHISEELFEKLRDAILSGALPAGFTFPNENDLCQRLNIGRGSLREAYSPLETLHLITRTKSGTYVNSPEEIQNSMNFEAIAQHTDAQNIAEYRRIMEVGTARLAALKATDNDIKRMEQILIRMREAAADPITLSQLDFDFHSALVKITGNELLVITFNTIRSIYESYTEDVFSRGYYVQSLIDHQNIIQALYSKDPSKVEKMVALHLEHIESFRNEQ